MRDAKLSAKAHKEESSKDLTGSQRCVVAWGVVGSSSIAVSAIDGLDWSVDGRSGGDEGSESDLLG